MTTSIHNFAKSFFWETRHISVPIFLAAAGSFELGLCVKKCIDHPEIVNQRITQAKRWAFSSFTAKPGETQEAFRSRLVKNVLKTTAVLALFGCAAALPFVFLPLFLAIPLAFIGVYGVFFVLQNAPKIPQKLHQVQETLSRAFSLSPQGAETVDEAHLRVLKNMGKAIVAAAAIAALIFCSYHLVLLGIAITASLQAGNFAAWQLLPSQTPLVVFLEYAFVGVLHFLRAAYSFSQGNTAQGVVHLIAGVFSLIFPFKYLFFDSINIPRLHHSFTGLLLMLAPWRSVQMLGAMIAFDSFLYFFAARRGYWNPKHHSYDFMNTVMKNLGLLTCALTALSFFQLVTCAFFKKDKESPASTCLDSASSPKK